MVLTLRFEVRHTARLRGRGRGSLDGGLDGLRHHRPGGLRHGCAGWGHQVDFRRRRFSAIAHDFGAAADTVVNWLWRQIAAATAVSLGGPGFEAVLAITAGIAVTVGLGLFVIQVVTSVVRHQPGGLVRAGRGLLVAFVAGGAAIAVVNLLLGAVDALSSGVVQVATGGNMSNSARSCWPRRRSHRYQTER